MSRALQEGIVAELPPEMQKTVRELVAAGTVPNEREGVTYVLRHPETVWKTNVRGRGTPLIVLGGSAILFALSLTYYLRKR